MYTVSDIVSTKIESYCRTWRMEIESSDSVITGDKIISASSTSQSTSLSDDIELGAVCSQSWNMTISDTETAFLGKEYDTYLYLVDYETSGILADEKIPMGRFTCVKSKKSGGSVQLTMASTIYRETARRPARFYALRAASGAARSLRPQARFGAQPPHSGGS